ncbi:Annexin domain-containing protein, partial [Cephalotus follicularis]
DEKAIISILGHRNLFQRKLIRLAYAEIYQEDLINQLKSELSGNFERAICLWTLDPPDRDAVIANTALHKANNAADYRVILEIVCIRSPEDLLAVKRSYRSRYKHSLEEDVASHTNGDIRQLLVAVTSTYRYDGEEIDEEMAHTEACMLRDAIGENGFNNDEMIRILSTRSKAQLVATFNRYRDIHGTSISKGLLGEPNNDYITSLRTVIRCINDSKKYLAKALRNAINTKLDVDEDCLSRIIITRAEKDLKEINELYLKRNNISLQQAVDRVTSGDYKAFLLALLGYENHSTRIT